MSAGLGADAADRVSYSVEVTRDARFQATAAALAVRTAELAGCPSDRARQLGEALDRVLGCLIACTPSGPEVASKNREAPGTIRIEFRERPRALEVDVSCSDDEPVSLRTLLERSGALGSVEPLVDSAEVTETSAGSCCRLVCHVPAR